MQFRDAKQCVNNLLIPSAIVAASALAGCATEGSKASASKDSTPAPLAIIQIEKVQLTSSPDCPVAVRISNRMKEIAWDGASYHLAMLNTKNVTVGKLMGVSHAYTKSGSDLIDTGRIVNTRCEDISGVSLIYFGYYPAGKKQVSLHINRVKTELK